MFLFLPIALLAGRLIPAHMPRIKALALILLSLIFYAWGDMKALPILLLSVGFNYASGRLLSSLKPQRKSKNLYRKIVMATSCITNVGMLCLFKYSGLSQPVGVSFYTFSALSYLADIYREKAECGDVLTDVCYMTFFPKLVSGPIVQYKDMKEQLVQMKKTDADVMIGVHLFMIGMFKKVLLADNLGIAFQQIYDLPKMAGMTAWLGMIYYGLQLYFDFSGYSDMAIGLARMFGFKFQPNFMYPYTSEGISEFWRKWHISLGAWFREYVYIPLGGNRCSKAAQFRNLSVVWLLTGIWHGNTWNFVVWGIFHGAMVVLEKFALKDITERIPRGLRIFMTDLLVFLGWVFFFSPSLTESFRYFGRMFGADGVGFVNGAFLYYLLNHLVLLVVSVIGCGPWVHRIYENIVFKQRKAFLGAVILHVVLFIFCIAYMVGSTYQTFMYFKF